MQCRKRINDAIELDEETKSRVERAEAHKQRSQSSLIFDKNKDRHIAKFHEEMHMAMMKLVAEEIHVAEIYSPPRVAKRAQEMGPRAGWSLDQTTRDSDVVNDGVSASQKCGKELSTKYKKISHY